MRSIAPCDDWQSGPELALVNAASFPVLLSFVGMYAALGPLLHTQFRLDHTGVLLVRLAGLPAMLMAPVAGWLVGRYGATRVGSSDSYWPLQDLSRKPSQWVHSGHWSSPA